MENKEIIDALNQTHFIGNETMNYICDKPGMYLTFAFP